MIVTCRFKTPSTQVENRAVSRSFARFHGNGADPGGSINVPREKKTIQEEK